MEKERKAGSRLEDFFLNLLKKVVLFISTPLAAFGILQTVTQEFKIAFLAFFGVIAIEIWLYQTSIMVDIRGDISEVKKGTKRIEEKITRSSSNPGRSTEEEKEERIETTGVGALAGMVMGSILGLLFGSIGVIVGGILGALAGNQIEYEDRRRRR
jgi:uncharacterized protein YcfJ